MTATTILESRPCRRCHGTGETRPVLADDEQSAELMRELLALGRKLEALRERGGGHATLNERTAVYARIREIDATEVVARADEALLLDMSTAALYKILNRKTGMLG